MTLKHGSLEGELFWEEGSYWTIKSRTHTEAWWQKFRWSATSVHSDLPQFLINRLCHQRPQWSTPVPDKPFESWGKWPASSDLITIPRIFKEFWEELEFPSLSCNDGDWMNRSGDRELSQSCLMVLLWKILKKEFSVPWPSCFFLSATLIWCLKYPPTSSDQRRQLVLD